MGLHHICLPGLLFNASQPFWDQHSQSSPARSGPPLPPALLFFVLLKHLSMDYSTSTRNAPSSPTLHLTNSTQLQNVGSKITSKERVTFITRSGSLLHNLKSSLLLPHSIYISLYLLEVTCLISWGRPGNRSVLLIIMPPVPITSPGTWKRLKKHHYAHLLSKWMRSGWARNKTQVYMTPKPQGNHFVSLSVTYNIHFMMEIQPLHNWTQKNMTSSSTWPECSHLQHLIYSSKDSLCTTAHQHLKCAWYRVIANSTTQGQAPANWAREGDTSLQLLGLQLQKLYFRASNRKLKQMRYFQKLSQGLLPPPFITYFGCHRKSSEMLRKPD